MKPSIHLTLLDRAKISSVVFGSTVSLTVWLKTGVASVFIVFLVTLLVFFVGSMTRLCVASIISLLPYSILLGIVDTFGFNEQLIYPFTLSGQILWGFLLLAAIRVYRVYINWKVDAIASLFALFSVLLLCGRNIFQTGNAFAGIFQSEDNAAWILTLHRATSEHPKGGGDFGPFFDLILFVSHSLINFINPSSSVSETFANAVVGVHLIVLFFLPFLAVAILLHLNKNQNDFKSLSSEIIIFASGLQVIWIHFITSGHISTGLSALATVNLVVLLSLDTSMQNLANKKVLLLFVSLAYSAASVWFPIAPFIILLLLVIAAQSVRSLRSQAFSFILLVFSISLIVVRELLPRFSTFRTEDSFVLSGAFNLLKMEGGVGSLGPFSYGWILIFLLLLLLLLPITEKPEIVFQTLRPVMFGLLTVVGLKITNLRVADGVVNYGARKYESVLVIVALVFFSLIVVRYISRRISTASVPIFALCLAITVFSQLPAIEQYLGAGTYSGSKNSELLQLGRAISKNLSVGGDVVCFDESGQVDKYLVYMCSRWTSAYADTDDNQKNEWRKAVLGEIPLEILPTLRMKMSPATKVVVIGPEVDVSERNPSWEFLVNQDWKLIFARDY